MEHRFRETAHKAVRIGDRLARMEAQRARAAEAMDLLKFFKVNRLCGPSHGSCSANPPRGFLESTGSFVVHSQQNRARSWVGVHPRDSGDAKGNPMSTALSREGHRQASLSNCCARMFRAR